MTRLALVAAFFVALLASPAAAQEREISLSWTDSTETLQAATFEHRFGTALLVTGLSANLGGIVGSFFSLFAAMTAHTDGGCFETCGGSRTDWGAIAIASISTASVGLVMFFVGLGLDVHGRVLRSRAEEPGVALGPNGLAVSF